MLTQSVDVISAVLLYRDLTEPYAKIFHPNVGSRAAEIGFKNLDFKVFTKKIFQTSKVQILVFIGFLRKPLKNPEFRLTIVAENCCISVKIVVFIATI